MPDPQAPRCACAPTIPYVMNRPAPYTSCLPAARPETARPETARPAVTNGQPCAPRGHGVVESLDGRARTGATQETVAANRVVHRHTSLPSR